MKKVSVWLGIAAVTALPGCASYHRTAKLAKYDLAAGYRFEQLQRDLRVTKTSTSRNSDELFVVLAFSGGGTRAAALAYGAMRQLRDVTFYWDEAAGAPTTCEPATSLECKAKERSLLDEVDVISSVSGGSFTSAYYALNGAAIFDTEGPFHQHFLYHPVQRDLFARAVYHPQNWARLRSRVEIAANVYSEHIFGSATFSDLQKRPRPYLIVNAADMSTGARFEFTQEQFDLLCADLGPFPIARAVAASSAFPGLLNSMTVDSFNTNQKDGGCQYTGPGSHTDEERATLAPRDKDWVDLALQSDRRSDRHYSAQQVLAYRDPRRKHLHLLDGGLTDNIGARAIMRGVGSTDRPVRRTGDTTVLGGWSALSQMNELTDSGERKTRTVLVIIVNARTARARDWDTKVTGPGTASVINVSTGVPMGNFSRETLTGLRDLLQDAFPPPAVPAAPKLYGLEVAFDDLPSEEERAFFSNMGTNFDLDRYEVDCLIDRGGSLLRNATLIEPSAASFASFVKDELKNGTIGVPAGPPPGCTPADGKQHLAVRSHYLDAGVQFGAALPGSDDVDGVQFAPGLTFHVARPHGWGAVVDIGPQSFPIVGTVGPDVRRMGDLRLWSFMGGIARTRQMGRSEATLGVSAGFGLGSFTPSLNARDSYGRLGFYGLEGNASNAWLIKPQASLWYNLSDRWAATLSASYVFARSTVQLTADDAVAFDRKVDAATFRLGAGIGFKLF